MIWVEAFSPKISIANHSRGDLKCSADHCPSSPLQPLSYAELRGIQAAPNSVIHLPSALLDIGHSSELSNYQGPLTSLAAQEPL